MDSRFRAAVEQARKSGDLYFAGMLSKERITTSLRESRAWFQDGSTRTQSLFGSFCLSASALTIRAEKPSPSLLHGE
jgi:hypothetical protein